MLEFLFVYNYMDTIIISEDNNDINNLAVFDDDHTFYVNYLISTYNLDTTIQEYIFIFKDVNITNSWDYATYKDEPISNSNNYLYYC